MLNRYANSGLSILFTIDTSRCYVVCGSTKLTSEVNTHYQSGTLPFNGCFWLRKNWEKRKICGAGSMNWESWFILHTADLRAQNISNMAKLSTFPTWLPPEILGPLVFLLAYLGSFSLCNVTRAFISGVSLCSEHHISAEDLVLGWVAYSSENGRPKLSDPLLEKMVRTKLSAKGRSRREPAETSTIKIYSKDTIDQMSYPFHRLLSSAEFYFHRLSKMYDCVLYSATFPERHSNRCYVMLGRDWNAVCC